jgi:hypothetical protein
MAAGKAVQQHRSVKTLGSTHMEHRWGRRLMSHIPVRLRCLQSTDSGCRCLGRLEEVSASGALIRTELGICPAATIAIETLAPALGLQQRELPASIVRANPGELAIEWMEFASTGVSAVLTESMLTSGEAGGAMPSLGPVRFCALAPDFTDRPRVSPASSQL